MVEEEKREYDLKESIGKIMQDLQSVTLTYVNAVPMIERVMNAQQLAETNINNANNLSKEKALEFNKLKNKKEVVNMMNEEDLVPKDCLIKLIDSRRYLLEAMEWQRFSLELQYILMPYLKSIIGGFKGFDTQKDVMTNFKEVQKEWKDLVENMVSNKLVALETDVTKVKDSVSNLRYDNDKKFNAVDLRLIKIESGVEIKQSVGKVKPLEDFPPSVSKDVSDAVVPDLSEGNEIEDIKIEGGKEDSDNVNKCKWCQTPFSNLIMLKKHEDIQCRSRPQKEE